MRLAFLKYLIVPRKKGGLTVEQVILGLLVIAALVIFLWYVVKIRSGLILSGSKLAESGLG